MSAFDLRGVGTAFATISHVLDLDSSSPLDLTWIHTKDGDLIRDVLVDGRRIDRETWGRLRAEGLPMLTWAVASLAWGASSPASQVYVRTSPPTDAAAVAQAARKLLEDGPLELDLFEHGLSAALACPIDLLRGTLQGLPWFRSGLMSMSGSSESDATEVAWDAERSPVFTLARDEGPRAAASPTIAELARLAQALGHDERLAAIFLLRRILGGQREYGRLDLVADRRDFVGRERIEELGDADIYAAYDQVQKHLRALGAAGEGHR